MKQTSVLRALSILSLADILQLSAVEEEIVAFKQVAGGEWVSASEPPRKRPEGKILSFPSSPQLKVKDLEALPLAGEEIAASGEGELTMDFILSQRRLWKEGVAKLGLLAAIDCYLNQVQIISIKEKNPEGKERIRFISTQGLLVNKKQS